MITNSPFTQVNPAPTSPRNSPSLAGEISGLNNFMTGFQDSVIQGYVTESSAVGRTANNAFTVNGNVTAFYTTGRRLRLNAAGTPIYVTVASSSFNAGSGLTTVTTQETTVPTTLNTVDLAIQPQGFTNPILYSPTINSPTINSATIVSPTINSATINSPTIVTPAISTPTIIGVIEGNPELTSLYRARIYLGTNQGGVPSGGIGNVVNLDTVDYDPNSNWDNTNKWYTAPVSGYYAIAGSTGSLDSEGVSGSRWGTAIAINGAVEKYSLLHLSNIRGVSPNVCEIIFLNAGDHVQLFMFQDSGSPMIIAGGGKYTSLAIHLLSV